MRQEAPDGERLCHAIEPADLVSVDIHRDGSAVVVVITGDFDMQTAHEPYEALTALFEEDHDVSGVLVDLGAVGFVDSTGLGGLIRLKQEADRHEVPVRLRALNQQLQSLFEVTGLNHEFTIDDAPEPEPGPVTG